MEVRERREEVAYCHGEGRRLGGDSASAAAALLVRIVHTFPVSIVWGISREQKLREYSGQ